MRWSTCVAYGLAVGLGGVTFLIAPSPTAAGPEVSVARAVTVAGLGSVPRAGARAVRGVQDDRGAAAGVPGGACQYDNLRFGEPALSITHSQKSLFDLFFYAETADDFVLFDPNDPDGLNGCVLDQVRFAVAHDTPTSSPDLWNGVKITIYQDRGNVCLGQPLAFECSRNPDKGPAGYPLPTGPGLREHAPCCGMPDKEAIVCELKVPMSKVAWVPVPNGPPGSYDITVFGLEQFGCVLEKNKKYWIAPAPEMDVLDFAGNFQGFTFLWTSPNPSDHEAQVFSPFLDTQWSGLQSQLGWPQTDLYLGITAVKEPPPVEPCNYQNLRLGTWNWAAQKDTSFPFYAETADDFILSDPDDPDGLNPCQLDSVTFAVNHDVVGNSPQSWSGVKITIYQDKSQVCSGQPLDPPCQRNPDKGPAGYPIATTDDTIREHQPCCPSPSKEAIVCELKVPMSKVAWAPLNDPVWPDGYAVTVFGLDQYNCLLEKNKKYWIAPAPVMDFSLFGQTFLITSPNPSDHEAQLILPEAGIDAWSQIQTQQGSGDPDLYLEVRATKAPPPVEACHYDNLRKGTFFPPFPIHSHKGVDFGWYAEAADDFVLFDPDDPNGANPCRLDEVRFAAWHDVTGSNPGLWDGVKITIYQDRGNVCGGQSLAPQCLVSPDKGPGGFPIPNAAGDREHGSCCLQPDKDAIVCELKVPMTNVSWVPQTGFPGLYDITVFGLESLICNLQKNKKYWIAPAPEMLVFADDGTLQGSTFLMTSANAVDHPAQVISEPFVGPNAWIPLTDPPLGLPETDLYLGVWAVKAPTCIWDCVGDDGVIGIDEFLAVLGRWGPTAGNPCDYDGDGMIGINEFLKVLGTWGTCP